MLIELGSFGLWVLETLFVSRQQLQGSGVIYTLPLADI